MTQRLEQGFRRRFRDLLALVRPRRLDFGVELLLGRGRERSAREGVPLVDALAWQYEHARIRVERRLLVIGACTLAEAPWSRFKDGAPPAFLCDHSLGGLARWLRAAGYDAREARGPGDALLRQARAEGRVALGSQVELLDRRSVRDRAVDFLWVPTGLAPADQLLLVLRDLGLELREPRCMACGGALLARDKAAVLPRIPPRTARWRDDYWTCAACDRLFWQGTHWDRIRAGLEAARHPPMPARSA
jgi:uncharacterized protein with PIN domain